MCIIHIGIYGSFKERVIKGLSLIYLMKFLNELNAKHESIIFEYQTSKTSITFLDTKVYIKNNKLYTKIYRTKTDRQTFFNINSEHPESLKTSIAYSQALRVVSATILLVCFACLKEHLRNKEKCFLFHFESSSRS